jgi:hypothetical protein
MGTRPGQLSSWASACRCSRTSRSRCHSPAPVGAHGLTRRLREALLRPARDRAGRLPSLTAVATVTSASTSSGRRLKPYWPACSTSSAWPRRARRAHPAQTGVLVAHPDRELGGRSVHVSAG